MKLRRLVVPLGLVSAVVIVGVVALLTWQTTVFVGEQRVSSFVALKQTLAGLAALSQSDAAVAAVSVKIATLQALASSVDKNTVSLAVKDVPDPVVIRANDFQLRPEDGTVSATLDVEASTGSLTVGAVIKGDLYFAGTDAVPQGSETSDDPIYAATFKVMPVSIAPRLKFGVLDWAPRQFFGTLVAHQVFTFFSDKLTLRLPYHPHLQVKVDQPGSMTVPFGDNNSGSLIATVTPTPIAVGRWLSVISPIFSRDGIVLAAALSNEQVQPTPVTLPSGAVTDSDVSKLRDEVRSASSIALPWFDRGVAVMLSRAAVEEISTAMRQALASESVTIQSTAISGRYFDKRWSDDILGDGGFFAEATDSNSVHAQLSGVSASIAFDESRGPVATVSLNAGLDAALHVHVDPLIGGGVGTTIGVHGAASPSVRAWLGSAEIPYGDYKLGIVGPVLQCTKIDITAKSDGKFKIGDGWATVPEIGATISELIGKDPLVPTIVSGLPIAVTLIGRSKPDSTDDVKVTSPLYATFLPTAFHTAVGQFGFALSSDVSVSVSDQEPVPLTPEELGKVQAAAVSGWNAVMAQQCPEPDGVRILVGDIEIGPNNELVKFLVSIGKLTKEMADRIGHEVSTEKLKEWVADPVGSFQRSTPAQVLSNPVGAVGDAVGSYCDHNWCP